MALGHDTLLDIRSQEAAIKLLPVTVFVAVLMVLGITGNSLACVFYGCKVQRTQTTNLILFISILDEITSVFMPRTIVILMFTYRYNNTILCKMDAFMTYILVCVTILILIVLAVTRYRLVCTPNKPKFSDRQVKVAVLISMVTALGVCSPCLFVYEVVPIALDVNFNNTLTNITGHYCGLTKADNFKIVIRVVNGFHFLAIVTSFVCLIVLYFKIRQRIKEQDKKRKLLLGKPSFKSYVNEITPPTSANQTNAAKEIPTTSETLHVPVLSRTNSSASIDINEDTDYVFETEYSETTVNPSENAPNGDEVPVFRQKKSKRRHKSKRKRLSTVARQQTMLIFCVTVTFMVSMLPYFVKAVFESFPVGRYDVGALWIQFCYRSYLINSAVNPLLYSFFNQPFRTFVSSVFCCPCRTFKTYILKRD